jgi:outer membrane biosynthesis protein TonB
MDTGAQQDAPDTDADTSGTGIEDHAGASNKGADTEEGKAPEQPEAQTAPEQTAPEQTTPAGLEQPAPQAPEKTARTPAKTSAPTKTPAPAPPKATPAPPPQAKPKATRTAKITKEKDVTPSASTTLTLHTSKGAARISSLINPKLEGRAPLQTKSGNSLGSLKEYCLKWNAADVMDTASSGKQKALVGTQVLVAGSPSDVPAKPRAIVGELFSIQQRLFLVSNATTVSVSPLLVHNDIFPQSP